LLSARINGITCVSIQEVLMLQDLEQTIRERAYHLWVADGCRDGEPERHWLAAERDILATLAVTAPAAPKGRSRRAAAAPNDSGAKPPAKARRRA
jgi:hypothetical protein